MRPTFDFGTNRWTTPPTPTAATPEPAPGHWSKPPPEKKPRRFTTTHGVLVAAVSIGLAYWVSPAFFPIGMVPLLVINTFYELQTSVPKRARKEDLRLIENAEDPDVCLVHLTIHRNGEVVGQDRGVVWFNEGQLLFNGHFTSFVLGGQDVLPVDQWPNWPTPKGEIPLPEYVLPLAIKEGRAMVELQPLAMPKGGAGTPQEMRFLKRYYEFRRRPPISTGPRQWPPFEPPKNHKLAK